MNTKHEQKTIILKNYKINVDDGIAELVKLLNQLGITTLFSCQGYFDKEYSKTDKIEHIDSYIMMRVDNLADLERLIPLFTMVKNTKCEVRKGINGMHGKWTLVLRPDFPIIPGGMPALIKFVKNWISELENTVKFAILTNYNIEV